MSIFPTGGFICPPSGRCPPRISPVKNPPPRGVYPLLTPSGERNEVKYIFPVLWGYSLKLLYGFARTIRVGFRLKFPKCGWVFVSFPHRTGFISNFVVFLPIFILLFPKLLILHIEYPRAPSPQTKNPPIKYRKLGKVSETFYFISK